MVLEVHQPLVDRIDAFLASSGLAASYFGKRATGNSEVVARLKAGRSITGRTEQKLVAFMDARSGTVDAASQSVGSCGGAPLKEAGS